MKQKLFALLILTALFSSCKSENTKTISNSAASEEISLLDTLTLKLNGSEKWIANKETHIGVTKMDSIIKSFSAENNTYESLGNALSKQTSNIIKKCNMKGEAHDQLHVVLVPMLDEISILKEKVRSNKSELAIETLEVLIKKYFNHFKT